MSSFLYRQIGRSFIDTLTEEVRSQESVVLLGARFGGKRYVLDRVHEQLTKAGIGPIVHLRLLREEPMTTESHVSEAIWEEVHRVNGGEPTPDDTASGFFGAIDWLYASAGRPIVLLAANVDALAHHLARSFLVEVRSRVEAGTLVVVLSGEQDFHDLVHGPNSEFNCANYFVLQGFDEEEFVVMFQQFLQGLGIDGTVSPDLRHHLWTGTGGSVLLMRLALWMIVESRARNRVAFQTPIDVSEIPESIKMHGILGAYGVQFLSHTTQLVTRDPSCWAELDHLIRGDVVEIGPSDGPPRSLELAGLATREASELHFASPLIEDFARHYYHTRRIGDLYASNGQWDEAFARYAQLPLEERLRPAGVDDRANVEMTIRALGEALHTAATKGEQDVAALFARGCRDILGIPEVSLWLYDAAWRPQLLDGFHSNKRVEEEIVKLLPSGSEKPSPGSLALPIPWNMFATAAILPTIRVNQCSAVVVGDFHGRRTFSRERRELVIRLLQHFVDAYTHAVAVRRVQARLVAREQHAQIVNAIFEALGSRVLDVGHALGYAARGLRNLGYRRVLFCLVDPQRERIQGVLDDSDDPAVRVDEMTDWPLDGALADLQPYVVHMAQPKIVPDASREPLANQTVVRRARMKALAVVPILNQASDAIGTIHVERVDGVVPSEEEVDDLLIFGRQLAAAIEQSERVNLLQSALDKMPEPVVVVDRLERMRYLNRSAAELLDTTPGWEARNEATRQSAERIGERAIEYVRESQSTGHRLVHHVKGFGNQPEYRGAILTDIIEDWANKRVGALVHVQDLNYLHRVFAAIQLIAEASDTASAERSMLRAAGLLGHQWGRLYLVDGGDPEYLASRQSFGFSDDRVAADFDQGGVRLGPRCDPGQESWWSIVRKAPLVFCHLETHAEGETVVTEHGLQAINVRDPRCPEAVAKGWGDFWIDIPLITDQGELGKLTLACDDKLLPEDFELLRVLSEIAAGLLGAFLRRDQDSANRERWVKQAAGHTVAVTAHNVKSRLAALPVLLSRYQKLEATYPDLKKLNDGFARILTATETTIDRMKERLSPIVPRFSAVDLPHGIRQTLASALSDNGWTFDCRDKSLECCADANLLEMALLELVQNSKDVAAAEDNLRVSVSAEILRGGSVERIRTIYQDNGPGVPTELKERIFDNFFSHRPGKKAGTGLGLSFVRRVIEAHGGTVSEVGQDGAGAKFVIEFVRYSPAIDVGEGNNV